MTEILPALSGSERAIIAAFAWGVGGAIFWIESMRYNGFPQRWNARHSRETGWSDQIGWMLPLCLIGGPLWWDALGIIRAMEPKKAAATMSDKHVTDYCFNHYITEHCTLCGNHGVIDSRGVRTSAGLTVGRLNYCICPNGQQLRDQAADMEWWLEN